MGYKPKRIHNISTRQKCQQAEIELYDNLHRQNGIEIEKRRDGEREREKERKKRRKRKKSLIKSEREKSMSFSHFIRSQMQQ